MRNKLIISIGTLQCGGAERVVSEISSMFCDHFGMVAILTWSDAPVFYDVDRRVRIVCAESECGSPSRLSQARWVRGFVKKERPDVFLSFLMPFNMMAIVARAFTGTRIVVCERQDPSLVKTPLLRGLRNVLYFFSSRIEVQTTAGKQYFGNFFRRKTFVIPNPNHITGEQRASALSSKKERKIVTIGRLIPQKNHALLLEAFGVVHTMHPDYRLEIYGDGEMREALQRKVDLCGLNHCVTLCGRTSDVVGALAHAQVFVLSSDVEGMPNALMEAMALGVPCIATDVSGVRDIIDDGENGFVVPVGNHVVLAEKMLQLIVSEQLRHQFSAASYSVFEKFDKDHVFKQWLELVSF